MNTATAPFFIATVEPDGQQCDAWPEQPLLLSLEQGGIDWPGLTPEEIAEGCVLPCVAYPASDVVLEAPSI